MRSTTENLLLWEQRIKSGLSVSQWCQNNEISKNQYHYWNHKISKNQKSDNEIAFDEIISIISDKTETKVINIKEHKRSVRKKGDREKLIKELPHEVVECVLNEEEAVCKICGSELKIIRKKKVRSEIEYIPAKLIIKDYVQHVYKCVEYGKNDTNPYDSIFYVPVPASVLTYSFA